MIFTISKLTLVFCFASTLISVTMNAEGDEKYKLPINNVFEVNDEVDEMDIDEPEADHEEQFSSATKIDKKTNSVEMEENESDDDKTDDESDNDAKDKTDDVDEMDIDKVETDADEPKSGMEHSSGFIRSDQ